MPVDLSVLCVYPADSIRQAAAGIDRGSRGIALVIDDNRHLLGTITDGDIRRAMLAGQSLDAPIRDLLALKTKPPVTAPVDAKRSWLLQQMSIHSIRQIPLLDKNGCVVDLATLDDLLPDDTLPLQAVIMAGGFGTRLRPLTDDLPKPMLPVGDRPLMERIIEQFRRAGIRRVNVTTHYQPEKIKDYFGDGQAFGVDISYVAEDRPLGTAGALGLMEASGEPLLVVNGDILTRVDFRAMLDFHREHKADLTVAVRPYDVQVPYGVMDCDGAFVQQVREKPQLTFMINAGIYLLEPSVRQYIPSGERFDMTDLIMRLINEQRPVVSFPIREYWLDIGKHDDYAQAQQDVQNGNYGA